MLPQTQRLVVGLIEVARRQEAAQSLARHLGADDLLIFVADPEIGLSLPAPGFPQTLPRGRDWQTFIQESICCGQQSAELPLKNAQTLTPVTAIAAPDGTVLVLSGGQPNLEQAYEIKLLLPLVGAAFRAEQLAITAAGHSHTARETAAQAQALVRKLEATRAELQQALIAAETATRAKDEFLATVSHELRTPLNAILGWAHMLRIGKLDEETVRRALETIERNARSQSQLIEDILDFSRIISGKLNLNVSLVDLVKVIEAAIDVVRTAADAKGIDLHLGVKKGVGPISADFDRLQQVMWNLLSNAIKFTPQGGRVDVRLEQTNSQVKITVSDTGLGISEEFLPQVFERFRQADNTSTRRYGGLGLGLAITRHIVELHGGTIAAYSAGEGQGASFIVELPRMMPTSAESSSASRQVVQPSDSMTPFADLPSLAGLMVLVVDDESDARELFSMILTQSGAQVTAVASVAEAMAALQRIKPDLLVSDIEMPDEDGYSLIRRVRALDKAQGGGTPAIALTAHARLTDRIRALSAGFHMHVPKPVEPSELVVTVANLCNRL